MKSIATLTVYLAVFVLSAGCVQGDADKGSETEMIVFRSDDGRVLTLDDLQEADGTIQYEILGSYDVPEEALELHRRAREAGSNGDFDGSLTLLNKASELAPEWPYPIYDRAFTRLLMQDFDSARADYQHVVDLASRGFFTAITALNTLNREERGELPVGTYLSYVSLEWIDDPLERGKAIQNMIDSVPNFAPAWKELANIAERDNDQLAAIERGLAASPDAQTEGVLLVNKALALNRSGNHESAVRILGELALDPDSPSDVERIAKLSLAQILGQ